MQPTSTKLGQCGQTGLERSGRRTTWHKALASPETLPIVDAFQDDIRRYLERRPVLARPDSRWYRARMCARRHRAAFLTVGGLLSVLLIAAILIVWQARLVRIQKRNAEEAKAIVISMLFDAHSYWGGGKPLSALDVLKHASESSPRCPQPISERGCRCSEHSAWSAEPARRLPGDD